MNYLQAYTFFHKKRQAQVCQKLRYVNDTIVNGWKAPGIYDAIRLGLDKLPSMDPFHEIDPLVDEDVTLVASNLNALCQLNEKELDVYRRVTDEQ